MGHICPRRKHPQLHFPPSGPMYRENTDSGYITPGKQVQMTKTAIRKRLHFTDERHDLVTAIRKYGVFADGPALPVRNTGFWARNGVSRHGKASISAKPARDTDFWTENGVSQQEKQLNGRKHVRDTGIFAGNGVSLHGKASVSAKPACDTDFWTENGVSLHGETAQSAKTRSRLVNEGRMRVGGQLRFRGCDFLLSLRPFF